MLKVKKYLEIQSLIIFLFSFLFLYSVNAFALDLGDTFNKITDSLKELSSNNQDKAKSDSTAQEIMEARNKNSNSINNDLLALKDPRDGETTPTSVDKDVSIRGFYGGMPMYELNQNLNSSLTQDYKALYTDKGFSGPRCNNDKHITSASTCSYKIACTVIDTQRIYEQAYSRVGSNRFDQYEEYANDFKSGDTHIKCDNMLYAGKKVSYKFTVGDDKLISLSVGPFEEANHSEIKKALEEKYQTKINVTHHNALPMDREKKCYDCTDGHIPEHFTSLLVGKNNSSFFLIYYPQSLILSLSSSGYLTTLKLYSSNYDSYRTSQEEVIKNYEGGISNKANSIKNSTM